MEATGAWAEDPEDGEPAEEGERGVRDGDREGIDQNRGQWGDDLKQNKRSLRDLGGK